jgi:hypothetical protein
MPSSAKLISPNYFCLSFPEGDLFLMERQLSPKSSKYYERVNFFGNLAKFGEKPWLSGSMDGAYYKLFVKIDGLSLKLTLELRYPGHLMVFRHDSKFLYPIMNLDKQLFDSKTPFYRLLDPYAMSKILWFISSTSKVLEYYRFKPTNVTSVDGNYRTIHGLILTSKNPPFKIKSAPVILDLAGNNVLKIYARDELSPSRKTVPYPAESLIATLQGLFYGYHQVCSVSLFSSSGSVGREEISISTPIFDDYGFINLKTYATANFLSDNFETQNISLSLRAKAKSQGELSVQMSLWRLVCHTLMFHKIATVNYKDSIIFSSLKGEIYDNEISEIS